MSLLDAVGWFGSALLVFSLMQARVLRFRIINTVACVILTIFNGVLGIWPMVARCCMTPACRCRRVRG